MIKLVVLGPPQAQMRHKTYSKGRGGKPLPFTKTIDPSAKAKIDFLRVVQLQAPDRPIDCPIHLEIKLYFAWKQQHYRSGKYSDTLKDNAPVWRSKTPDADNCAKFIMDSLNGIFWRDDGRIAHLEVRKLYSKKPRTEIVITELQNLYHGDIFDG